METIINSSYKNFGPATFSKLEKIEQQTKAMIDKIDSFNLYSADIIRNISDESLIDFDLDMIVVRDFVNHYKEVIKTINSGEINTPTNTLQSMKSLKEIIA